MELVRGGRGRDLRVDFFRGCALWWIFADHIPDNVMAQASLHMVALNDAAEVFVLLAGFGAAKAYGAAMARNGWFYGAAEALKRAWVLYIAHIFLFVVYAAQVSNSVAALDRATYLDEARLDVLARAPYRALLEALTLRYQPSLLNILPLYVVLLAMFAFALPLLRRPRLMLAGSAALYLAARAWQWNLPGWHGTGWYFDPLTWQLLFTIGALMATSPPDLSRFARPLDFAAGAMLAFGLALKYLVWPHPALVTWLPITYAHALLWMDKTSLDPARILSILAMVWLVVRLVPAEARWLQSRAAKLLVLAGQHSLPVFCWGIFLGFFARLGLEVDDGAGMQVAVNLGGALAMLAVATVAAWYAGAGRSRRAPAAPGAGREDA
ncbi:MAG: OpgC domain-containing protein [Rhodospirillales bacterium]|nr:OpgC domain-containing protein [Rhodospirillales bacterium]